MEQGKDLTPEEFNRYDAEKIAWRFIKGIEAIEKQKVLDVTSLLRKDSVNFEEFKKNLLDIEKCIDWLDEGDFKQEVQEAIIRARIYISAV